MNKEKFTFELVDKYTPYIVIRNFLKQIKEETKGYVTGNIERYDGPVYSYTKQIRGAKGFTGLAVDASLRAQSEFKTVEVDIQQDLGEQNTERNTFEVYLSVKGLEHYKYRMMFVDYGTISYPVKVIMNEDLAVAYSGRRKDVFTVDSMKKLEEMMDKIMNSEMMISLIQSLINESLRQESKEVS